MFRHPGTYDRLHGLGRHLRAAMGQVLERRQIVGQVIGDGPLAQLVFSPDPVTDYRSTHKGDRALGRALMLALFERGVFLNPMGTKLYISVAHDEAVCDAFCDRLDDALAEVTGP